MPHGSGFDSDIVLDIEASSGEKLVLHGAYHVMNECGSYVGWYSFTVTVTPSLIFDFHLKIRGEGDNRQVLKYVDREYILDVIHDALQQEIDVSRQGE